MAIRSLKRAGRNNQAKVSWAGDSSLKYFALQGRPNNTTAPKTLLTKVPLKNGKAIWYAPDQNYGAEHSVFVNFFNIPAATITATSRLASMNNSPVIPFSHQRSADNKSYTLRLQPPLENFPSDDVVNDTQRINNILEKEIEKMPEQYLWSHRRFKTRPGNMPSLY